MSSSQSPRLTQTAISVSLFGLQGSGKTTLAHMLRKLGMPDEAELTRQRAQTVLDYAVSPTGLVLHEHAANQAMYDETVMRRHAHIFVFDGANSNQVADIDAAKLILTMLVKGAKVKPLIVFAVNLKSSADVKQQQVFDLNADGVQERIKLQLFPFIKSLGGQSVCIPFNTFYPTSADKIDSTIHYFASHKNQLPPAEPDVDPLVRELRELVKSLDTELDALIVPHKTDRKCIKQQFLYTLLNKYDALPQDQKVLGKLKELTDVAITQMPLKDRDALKEGRNSRTKDLLDKIQMNSAVIKEALAVLNESNAAHDEKASQLLVRANTEDLVHLVEMKKYRDTLQTEVKSWVPYFNKDRKKAKIAGINEFFQQYHDDLHNNANPDLTKQVRLYDSKQVFFSSKDRKELTAGFLRSKVKALFDKTPTTSPTNKK